MILAQSLSAVLVGLSASVAAVPTVALTARAASTTTYPSAAKDPFPAGTLRGLNALAALHGRYFGTALEELQQRVNDTKYTYLNSQ